MIINVTKSTAVLLFSLLLAAPVAWALDADDQDSADGSNEDTTSKTEDAAAGPKTFDPPHDDQVDSKPEQPTGASKAGGVNLSEAATDPSAILTQFQNFFWTTSTEDNKNIANTYLFQAVLPLSKKNLLRPAIPLVNPLGSNSPQLAANEK